MKALKLIKHNLNWLGELLPRSMGSQTCQLLWAYFLLMTVRNIFFGQQVFDYWNGRYPEAYWVSFFKFNMVLKSLQNHCYNPEGRSLLRNIVWEFIRVQNREILFGVWFRGLDFITNQDFVFRNLQVLAEQVVVTTLVHTFIKRHHFKQHALLWGIAQVEYVACFGVGFVDCLEQAEAAYPGNIFVKVAAFLNEMHFGLVYFMAEQVAHGGLEVDLDITSLDRISNNMGTYGPYMLFALLWVFVLPAYGLPDLYNGLNYSLESKGMSYPQAMFNILTFTHSLTMHLCAISWTISVEDEAAIIKVSSEVAPKKQRTGKQKFF